MAVMLDVLTRADQLADHRPDLALEAAYLPSVEKIIAAIRATLS